jgi:hypothetical protein
MLTMLKRNKSITILGIIFLVFGSRAPVILIKKREFGGFLDVSR